MAAPEIPRKHKACVYTNPGQNAIAVEDVETPKPGPGDVLIKLTHSGVCHSDYAVMTNGWKTLPYPTPAKQVGGHEGVGEVVALGEGVTSRKIGDREFPQTEQLAKIGKAWSVGTLFASLYPRELVFANTIADPVVESISGYYHPGTYQQYAVGPADYVTPIPDSLSSEVAAPMLCAGVTTYSALRRSNLRAGQWLVISGAGGGLGHIAVQLATKGFAFRVIGIDLASKKDLIMESGAEHFLDATLDSAELVKQTKALTGGLGAQSCIVCNNREDAYDTGLQLLKFGGTLVCVGMPEGQANPIKGAAPVPMIGKLLTITSVAVGNRRDAIEVLEMAARGVVNVKVEVRKMEDLEKTFTEMEERKLLGRVVLELK
ncbi:MAG: hypothetical protein MMC23_002268 [Stictis urceolatum]|nr:hypothetical protein [Stictis urceolata]